MRRQQRGICARREGREHWEDKRSGGWESRGKRELIEGLVKWRPWSGKCFRGSWEVRRRSREKAKCRKAWMGWKGYNGALF